MTPAAYGEFLCRLFDRWTRDDPPAASLRTFEGFLADALGVPGGDCLHQRQCGSYAVVEHTGDVYACDFLVEPDFRLGNLLEAPLWELVRGPEQRIIGLTFPMVRDADKLALHWDRAAQTIWQHLKLGYDCAFVNEGDPFLFGTAIYVVTNLQKAHPGVEITVIPGVSSINASAARAALPLAINDEKIAILSGHCDDTTIRETLEKFDTVVFLKVNSVFGRLIDVLEELKLVEKCVYVSKATSLDEKLVRNIRELRGQKLDYLSLLIVSKLYDKCLFYRRRTRRARPDYAPGKEYHRASGCSYLCRFADKS